MGCMMMMGCGGGMSAAFSPADLATLYRWYNNDLELADGADVDTWPDSSANNSDIVSGANTATFKATGGPNGEPCVSLDSSFSSFTGTVDSDLSVTVFVVLKKRTAPTASGATALAFSDNAAKFGTDTDYSTGYSWYATEAIGRVDLGGVATDWNIVAIRINSAASLDFYINGGTPISFNPWNELGATSWRLGGSGGGGADCDYAEVIWTNDAASQTDLNLIGNYLADKYALTWTDI